MVLKNEFNLSDFFKRNFQLFVILGIFGAFTIYLKGFFNEKDPNILIEYGIIASFLITILISLVIICNSFENISFEKFSLENIMNSLDAFFLVGKGNITRGLFLIPFIVFLLAIISTILTSFGDALPAILSTGVWVISVILFFNLFQYLIQVKKNWNIIVNYLVKFEVILLVLYLGIHFYSPTLPESYSKLLDTLFVTMIGFPIGAILGILMGAILDKLGFFARFKPQKQKTNEKKT
jgi:hypothetical protein